MARKSFRDPVTGVLKTHGFVQTNNPGDIAQDEADDFALQPGAWKWDGTAWVAFAPPPDPVAARRQQIKTDLQAANSLPDLKAVMARALQELL